MASINILAYFTEMSPKDQVDLALRFSTLVVTIIGLRYTLPLIRRKFSENQLNLLLGSAYSANRVVAKEALKLILKYVDESDGDPIPSVDILKTIVQDFDRLNEKATDCTSNVSTLVFTTNTCLRELVKFYNQKHDLYRFYDFLINLLERVIFLANNTVVNPKSFKLKKIRVAKKSIDRYVTANTYDQYKHIRLGLSIDPESAETLVFFGMIARYQLYDIGNFANQIFNSPSPWAKLMLMQKFYIPPILNYAGIGGTGIQYLMVGYKMFKDYNDPNADTIRCHYMIRRKQAILVTFETNVSAMFFDIFIESEIDMGASRQFSYNKNTHSVCFEFLHSEVSTFYTSHEKRIRKAILQEVNKIGNYKL
jgi:hypothetical protein